MLYLMSLNAWTFNDSAELTISKPLRYLPIYPKGVQMHHGVDAAGQRPLSGASFFQDLAHLLQLDIGICFALRGQKMPLKAALYL